MAVTEQPDEEELTEKQRQWLAHRATPEQLAAFRDTGYLVVPNAVHPALLGRLSDVADRVAADQAEGIRRAGRIIRRLRLQACDIDMIWM